ncbi:hypothetical protein L3i20_v224830 [Paenibacillus sp. L3-i20]|nr:hypothetical protein L3i20_v224830 [Paenibacillus sp. L3-i20]
MGYQVSREKKLGYYMFSKLDSSTIEGTMNRQLMFSELELIPESGSVG